MTLYLHAKGQEKLDENSVAGEVFLMSLQFSILAAAGAVLWWNRLSWREAFGFGRGGTMSPLILGAGMAVIFLPVGKGLQYVSLKLIEAGHGQAPVQEAVKMLQDAHSPESRVAQVFFAVMLAPVAEEMLFRGILYPAIKQFKLPRVALFSTAILFAAAHENPPIFLPLMVLGLALALLYEKTGNLLAPITAHAVFNGINIIWFYQQTLAPAH